MDNLTKTIEKLEERVVELDHESAVILSQVLDHIRDHRARLFFDRVMIYLMLGAITYLFVQVF